MFGFGEGNTSSGTNKEEDQSRSDASSSKLARTGMVNTLLRGGWGGGGDKGFLETR